MIGVVASTPLCVELRTLQQQQSSQQQLYHVSDQDGLHLSSAQVAQDVGGKQGRHLQDKHTTKGHQVEESDGKGTSPDGLKGAPHLPE